MDLGAGQTANIRMPPPLPMVRSASRRLNLLDEWSNRPTQWFNHSIQRLNQSTPELPRRVGFAPFSGPCLLRLRPARVEVRLFDFSES
jgi:hypothetical protein